MKRFTADALIRAALFELRVLKEASAKDYEVAGMLLSQAQELVPDDVELVHRRLEAAWGAGDEKLVLQLSERIVMLDPRDTVAQLRIISARSARPRGRVGEANQHRGVV